MNECVVPGCPFATPRGYIACKRHMHRNLLLRYVADLEKRLIDRHRTNQLVAYPGTQDAIRQHIHRNAAFSFAPSATSMQDVRVGWRVTQPFELAVVAVPVEPLLRKLRRLVGLHQGQQARLQPLYSAARPV